MTAARTARRKDVRLARRSSAGDSPARLVAPHRWLTASAKQRLDTLFAPPASPIALPTAPSAHLSLPDPRSLRRRPRPNPHRARCAGGAPLTAISCTGASRTPPVGVRGGVRHAGVRETCTGPDSCSAATTSAETARRVPRPPGRPSSTLAASTTISVICRTRGC